MQKLYRPLNLRETPILFTGRETAELIKYASNGFLATKISFINEISDICEKVGADVQQVAKGIGLDGRIGSKFYILVLVLEVLVFQKILGLLQKLAKKIKPDLGLLRV